MACVWVGWLHHHHPTAEKKTLTPGPPASGMSTWLTLFYPSNIYIYIHIYTYVQGKSKFFPSLKNLGKKGRISEKRFFPTQNTCPTASNYIKIKKERKESGSH